MVPHYDQVIDLLYAAVTQPATWPEALAAIADFVGATGALLVRHTPVDAEGTILSARLREDISELYLDRYQDNPYRHAIERLPASRAYVIDNFLDRDALLRTAFHADILAPQQIAGIAVVPVSSLCYPGASGGIALMLNPRQAEESRQAVEKFGLLAGHIERATGLSLLLGQRPLPQTTIAAVIETMPGASILIDANGHIVHVNQQALHLLAEADGLSSQQQDGLRLRAAQAGEQRRLTQHLAQALATASGGSGEVGAGVRVSRPSGRPPLLVVATPMPAMMRDFWSMRDKGGYALVQLIAAKQALPAQAQRLAALAGLTPAEAEVLALIGGAYSVPETAAQLGLSVNTVKTHLSHCYAKTETHSQSALATLLAGMPPTPRDTAG